jgi:hypothetical protein
VSITRGNSFVLSFCRKSFCHHQPIHVGHLHIQNTDQTALPGSIPMRPFLNRPPLEPFPDLVCRDRIWRFVVDYHPQTSTFVAQKQLGAGSSLLSMAGTVTWMVK